MQKVSNYKLTLFKDSKLVFVSKYVVMAENLKMLVMMVTKMMEMDVPPPVMFKMDGLVLEDRQLLLTHV